MQGNLSVFEVEVLDEVGVDPADLWHEVEGLVEVLLPQALVLQELLVVDPLDGPLREVAEPVDTRLAREFNGPLMDKFKIMENNATSTP